MKALLSPVCLGLLLVALAVEPSAAQARLVRVVTYNIEADLNGVTAPLPGLIAPPGNPANYALGGVLEGIGEELVNRHAQPLDVLALEETTSNSQTVAPIVNALNAFYGIAGMYSNSSYQATQSGANSDGNGTTAVTATNAAGAVSPGGFFMVEEQ